MGKLSGRAKVIAIAAGQTINDGQSDLCNKVSVRVSGRVRVG